jgi:hypothetical protein
MGRLLLTTRLLLSYHRYSGSSRAQVKPSSACARPGRCRAWLPAA